MRLARLIISLLALVCACSSSDGLSQRTEPLNRPPMRPRRLQLPDPTPPPVLVAARDPVVEPVRVPDRVVVPEPERVEPPDEVIAMVPNTPVTPTVPDVRMPELDCTTRDAVGYKKGRRTPIEIVSVDGSPVELSTANAFWSMSEAAAKDGVELVIYSAFRSPEEQEYFYRCYTTCSCNGCSRAAKPGFSNHQMGKALDIAIWSPEVHPWLAANAKTYGFSSTVPGEPWHWEFKDKPKKKKQKKKAGVCG